MTHRLSAAAKGVNKPACRDAQDNGDLWLHGDHPSHSNVSLQNCPPPFFLKHTNNIKKSAAAFWLLSLYLQIRHR